MNRLFGILKIAFVLAIDFAGFYAVLQDVAFSLIAVGIITAYVLFGGYIAILKDGAISSKKLPIYQKTKLENAKTQLSADVKAIGGMNISGLKLYLVQDDDMNAAAYGCKCVSVTQATIENTDAITLNSVIAHELSHIENFDAEFNRAVFCSVTLLVGVFSVISFIITAVVFLFFAVFNCFRSWLGFAAYQGMKKAVKGTFGFLQRGTVALYRTVIGLLSRHAEYRSDSYSCKLGYGVQLSHFLSLSEPNGERNMTITEAIYRSHPPTPNRIARLEKQLLAQNTTEIANRYY